MKIKTLLTLAAAIAMSFTAAVADDTPLGKQMSAINKNLRAVKRNLADPSKKQDNLDALKKVNEAIAESAKLEPKSAEGKPDKAAYLAKYKAEMEAVGKSVGELEEAIKADKQDDAKKILEKLTEQKEKGHKDFEVD